MVLSDDKVQEEKERAKAQKYAAIPMTFAVAPFIRAATNPLFCTFDECITNPRVTEDLTACSLVVTSKRRVA